jgi:hypothetical protein
MITVNSFNCNINPAPCRVVKVFPNPAVDVINIGLEDKTSILNAAPIAICRVIKDDTMFSYHLFNAQGEKIRTGHLTNLSTKIVTQNLPMGFYYLHILEDGLPIHRQTIQIVQN